MITMIEPGRFYGAQLFSLRSLRTVYKTSNVINVSVPKKEIPHSIKGL